MKTGTNLLKMNMVQRYVFSAIYLAGALSLTTLLTGCGLGSTSTTALESRVRVLNAFVPATGVDGSLTVTSNTIPLTPGSSLPFGQFETGGAYTTVPSGSFTATALGPALPAALQFQTAPALNGNNAAYTLLAIGQSGQTGVLAPQLILFPNFTAGQITIPSGSVAVRVINVSLNANAIGLESTSNGIPSAPVAASLGSVSYSATGASAYSAVSSTQLANMALVDVTNTQVALTLSSGSNLNSFAFVSGQAYTLFVYGQPGNTAQPLGATWIQDFP